MNANYKLKFVFAAFAFMLPRFLLQRGSLHYRPSDVRFFALRANANLRTP